MAASLYTRAGYDFMMFPQNKYLPMFVDSLETQQVRCIDMTRILEIVTQTGIVAGQMSPYLIFGFLAAGVLYVFVSPSWMRRNLGGRGIVPVVKSVLFGVPLPLCSCGVIAVTASIRKQGAGRGAATGFLLATPQTGVDSIFATWGMLGPALGIFRPLIALITGIIGGGIAALFDDESGDSEAQPESCATGIEDEERPERSVREVLRYGLVTLPRDIAKPLIVGVILAGMIAALAPRDMLAPYIGGGILAMLIMTVVGAPLYVCATASIPVAVSFMHLGASPGAALVFLIAGPATNAATMATVWNVLGKRTLFIYLGTILISSVAAGLLFDAMSGWFGITVLHDMRHAHDHHEGIGVWNIVLAVLLALVVLNSLYGDRISALVAKRHGLTGTNKDGAPQVELSINGMTCIHCVHAITRALRQVTGAREVEVDLAHNKAVVLGEGVNPDELVQALATLGYDATVVG